MRFILSLVAMVLIGFHVHAAREVRNGGGGMRVEGRYLTYYSANGKVQQEIEVAEAIPGLDLLVREIISLPLSSEMRAILLNQVDASSFRRYYRIAGDALDPKLREKLVNDYSELYQIPKDQVVIFAVTNDKDRSTVLLPEFYALNPQEQAAMVMHESMWLRGPSIEYSDVLRAEQYTQAYFEDKNDPDRLFPFMEVLQQLTSSEDIFAKVKAGLTFDLQHRRFPEVVGSQGKILLKNFLGENFARAILCMTPDQVSNYEVLSSISESLYYEMRFNYEAKKASLFYKGIAEALQDGAVFSRSKGDFQCRNNVALETTYLKLSYVEVGTRVQFQLVDPRGASVGYLELSR